MEQKTIQVQNEFSRPVDFNNDKRIKLIAGLNVIENSHFCIEVGLELKRLAEKYQVPFIFKASFDKANRSSIKSFRGPGIKEGLAILKEVRETLKVPVVTDVHEPFQCEALAECVDIIQIPAFLCRQTDLLAEAAKTKRPLLIKRMQMMAPWDVKNILRKCESLGNDQILVCERGTSFGYNNLVVDPLAFAEMRKLHYPVVFDVTHSLQCPGGRGESTDGRGEYALPLAWSAACFGIAGLFLETHPKPEEALCDGPSATPLNRVDDLLKKLVSIDTLIKEG